MGDYEKAFDWVQFPEGRARFAGCPRGWDERGHEAVAVDVNGTAYYGEINQKFLPNGNDFNVEITSFGHRNVFDVGSPPPWTAFTSDELRTIQALITRLVQVGLGFEDRPLALSEFPNASFMGEVIFSDGWAL